MGFMEWVGFVTGVICVALIVVEKDINWPIGLLNSLALLYVFFVQKLYAQVGLQIFYVLECLYGWWMWTRTDRATGMKLIRIGRTKADTLLKLAGITVVGVAILAPIFARTGDPAPFWDSVVAVVSLVAEYMLCIKLYEAWPAYAAADVISLVVLARLGAWITFSTYLVFLILCVMGMIEWLRRLKNASRTASSSASSTPSTVAINT